MEAVPLESIEPASIEGLLVEEVAAYAQRYRWDFSGTADLVRQLVAAHNLGGVALKAGERVVGYSYTVIEDQKGLIGDAYVLDEFGTAANEGRLMSASIAALREFPQVRRVEAQPMMLRHAYSHARAERHERRFLEAALTEVRWPGIVAAPAGYRLEGWSWRLQDEAAGILYRAYRNHMDAEINDQYRSPGRARTYVNHMVSYPSCGSFDIRSSFLVMDTGKGEYVGMVCCCVAEGVGHIAQLCVEPAAQGRGLGRLLLTAGLAAFAEAGLGYSTLAVTAANGPALGLYRSMGYEERARLAAYVWPVWPF